MKRYLLFLFSIFIILMACSHSDKDKERFMRCYKEILVARERYQDTTIANAEVIKTYRRNKYSEEQFFEDWRYYTQDPEEFIIMMDSIRTRAQRELMKLEKSK